MNLEERQQLGRFLQLLAQAQAGAKDPEAQALIADACARQPDAPYLLVQRVLQLEHALKDATQKPGFIGDANAWGRAPVGMQPHNAPPPQAVAQVPTPPAVPSVVQPAVQPQPSAWGSGILGNVAMAAGGVVAGSLLARGIGSLFGHHEAPADHTAIPPGGGTLVETDYGSARADAGSEGRDSGEDFSAGGDGDAVDLG